METKVKLSYMNRESEIINIMTDDHFTGIKVAVAQAQYTSDVQIISANIICSNGIDYQC